MTAVASPAASDPSKARSPSPNAVANANPGQGNPNPGQGNANPGQGNANPGQGNPNPGQGNANPGQGNANPGQGNQNPGQGNANQGQGTVAGNPEANANGNPNPGNPNPGNGNPSPGNANAANGNAGNGDGEPGAGAAGAQGNRGNNGTVKVVMEDELQHPGNEPQGCLRGLDFYNFDTGQMVDVVFSAHSPTGDPVVLFRVEDVVMGARGHGNEANRATLLLDGVNGASGIPLGERLTTALTAPGANFFFHPQQGWHVKVAVIDHDAAGVDQSDTRKSKVFWHRCPATPATSGDNPPVGIQGSPDVGTSTAVIAGTVGPTAEQGGAPVTPAAPATPGTLGSPAIPATPAPPASDAPGQVAGADGERAQSAEGGGRATEVKGASFERSPLARTGLDPFGLARLAAGLVLAGAAATTVGRRRSRDEFVSIQERLVGY